MTFHPRKYNKGLVRNFRQIIADEGIGALSGIGPTAATYMLQGFFKFGGVEFFKINTVKTLGEERAWNNRNYIYLGSSACAEFIADIFLCPLQATRIRLVSDPKFAPGLLAAVPKIIAKDGAIKGFYSDFGWKIIIKTHR